MTTERTPTPEDEDDPVLEAGLESFPASDPPAWSTKARRLEEEKQRSIQQQEAEEKPEPPEPR